MGRNKNCAAAYISHMDKQYRQWLQEHQDHVWSLARYLLRDRGEAEDVTQEAFIRLWQHRERLQEAQVRPWLLRVTRNLCLDRVRRRQPEVEWDENAAAGDDSPQDGLQRSEASRWLQRAIAALQEPYRSLIILRDLQQHSYEEVAGVTELTMPQVKTYLHRARRQLREQLLELQT